MACTKLLLFCNDSTYKKSDKKADSTFPPRLVNFAGLSFRFENFNEPIFMNNNFTP